MQLTLKPIIIQGGRRKDGTWPVYIRVTFKGTTRRLPSTLVCTADDLTRSGKIKNATILQKGSELCARMRATCDDLSPFTLEGWTVDDVVAHIRRQLAGDSFRLDFFTWADGYIAGKAGSTRVAYVTALNTLERFLGKRQLDVNDISRAMLLDFADFADGEPKMHRLKGTGEIVPCTKEKLKGAAGARHLMKLAHIFNAAKDRYNDEDAGRILIPRSPFAGISRKAPPSKGQESLGVELMQQIILAEAETPYERRALDVFVVSFGLEGVNLADLWRTKPFEGGVWKYNRQKTEKRRADHAAMRVTVPEVLQPYIARLQDGPRGWWLPALHHGSKDGTTAVVNRGLRKWAERNDVQPFTFGAARHSWASIARQKAKVEKATVDECLVHVGEFRITDIYAERAWDLLDEANAKVLALFRWPSGRSPLLLDSEE